ncbi:hypothetical protein GF323_07145 [Candidatus Woesearchaeota archaeon]|nr:hypothetical protein [Candidatus Woesearchaeota archaeon]
MPKIYGCNKCKYKKLKNSVVILLGIYGSLYTNKKFDDNSIVFICIHKKRCVYEAK